MNFSVAKNSRGLIKKCMNFVVDYKSRASREREREQERVGKGGRGRGHPRPRRQELTGCLSGKEPHGD